jgi:hypothetical protein
MKLLRLIKMCLNETCSKVHTGRYLSDNFPFQNGLKQGYALLPLLFNFALEYAFFHILAEFCVQSLSFMLNQILLRFH